MLQIKDSISNAPGGSARGSRHNDRSWPRSLITDKDWSSSFAAGAVDRLRAGLTTINCGIGGLSYKVILRETVTLPMRQRPHGGEEPNFARNRVPERH